MTAPAASVSESAGWAGRLSLRFTPGATHTRMVREAAFGPLCVQKPFYPEGDPCHVYLLHPPGGVAGGDSLTFRITVDKDAHALITTPAANKFYRSDVRQALLDQRMDVAAGATLEWLPGETILFGGTHAALSSQINLTTGAKFIGWECVCLGRPASGDHYAQGQAITRMQITQDGQPLLSERLPLNAGDARLDAPWGLAGRRVLATLYAQPADADLLRLFRSRLPPNSDLTAAQPISAASVVDGLLTCRILGHEVEAVRDLLIRAWQVLRPPVIGQTPSVPRIWHT